MKKMKKKKHRHKFEHMEIHWISVWDRLDHGKAPQPCFIALACRCGAIKLVPAKVISGKRKVVQEYKK